MGLNPRNATDPRSVGRRGLVSTAWSYLEGSRRKVVGLAVIALLVAQAETLALVLIALLAEGAAEAASTVDIAVGTVSVSASLPQATVLAVGCVVIAAGLTLVHGSIASAQVAILEARAREAVVEALAQAEWEYQSRQKVSRVEGRIRIAQSPGEIFAGLIQFLRALSAVAVFVVAAVAINPTAAAFMVVLGLVFSVAVRPLRQRARTLAGKAARYKVAMTDELVDAINQGADAQVFGAWPFFERRFFERSRALADVRRDEGVVHARFPVAYQYGSLLLLITVLGFVVTADFVSSLGAFAASALLLLRSVQYGQAVQLELHRLAMYVPQVEQLAEESRVPTPRFVPGDSQLKGIRSVELKAASYVYPGSDDPALRDLSLTMTTGRIVGIAGHSGSGKSTLGQVLLRLRWPTSGQYLVNGRDAREYTGASWHSLVGHVPQSPQLLHATLGDNVSYFDPGVTVDDVIEALTAVGLDYLLRELPEGLDTYIGPTGHSLSGGQVQRIGIARVLARRAQLVVLDEPTSALDVDSEALVADALEALASRPDTIVVVIAHRASTLLRCESLFVLSEGALADAGTLASVRTRNPFLARILDVESTALLGRRALDDATAGVRPAR